MRTGRAGTWTYSACFHYWRFSMKCVFFSGNVGLRQSVAGRQAGCCMQLDPLHPTAMPSSLHLHTPSWRKPPSLTGDDDDPSIARRMLFCLSPLFSCHAVTRQPNPRLHPLPVNSIRFLCLGLFYVSIGVPGF